MFVLELHIMCKAEHLNFRFSHVTKIIYHVFYYHRTKFGEILFDNF